MSLVLSSSITWQEGKRVGLKAQGVSSSLYEDAEGGGWGGSRGTKRRRAG